VLCQISFTGLSGMSVEIKHLAVFLQIVILPCLAGAPKLRR